ncbi:hypothetical protein HC823_01360 [Candidatus Gracilibacteria bacterium]|nr:hypothetical protein [Candidatus Gracilibacteria bacterium]
MGGSTLTHYFVAPEDPKTAAAFLEKAFREKAVENLHTEIEKQSHREGKKYIFLDDEDLLIAVFSDFVFPENMIGKETATVDVSGKLELSGLVFDQSEVEKILLSQLKSSLDERQKVIDLDPDSAEYRVLKSDSFAQKKWVKLSAKMVGVKSLDVNSTSPKVWAWREKMKTVYLGRINNEGESDSYKFRRNGARAGYSDATILGKAIAHQSRANRVPRSVVIKKRRSPMAASFLMYLDFSIVLWFVLGVYLQIVVFGNREPGDFQVFSSRVILLWGLLFWIVFVLLLAYCNVEYCSASLFCLDSLLIPLAADHNRYSYVVLPVGLRQLCPLSLDHIGLGGYVYSNFCFVDSGVSTGDGGLFWELLLCIGYFQQIQKNFLCWSFLHQQRNYSRSMLRERARMREGYISFFCF